MELRRPGIEPGSTAWKAAMLTIIPPTLLLLPATNFGMVFRKLAKQPPGCSLSLIMLATPEHRSASLGDIAQW